MIDPCQHGNRLSVSIQSIANIHGFTVCPFKGRAILPTAQSSHYDIVLETAFFVVSMMLPAK